MLVTVSSMWFRGRWSGAATVLVLEPSQVTDLLRGIGALVATVPAVGFELLDAAGFAADFTAEGDGDGSVAEVPSVGASVEGDAVVGTPVEGDAVVEASVPAPLSWTSAPSSHAVRERAARTTVAAAATRRVPEFRILDMQPCLIRCSGGCGAWMIGACGAIRPSRHILRTVGTLKRRNLV